MKNFTKFILLSLVSISISFAQSDFSVSAYRDFLDLNKDLTYDQLAQMHNAGLFERKASANLKSVVGASLEHRHS